MKTMKRPTPPHLINNQITNLNETTVHPLCQKTIIQKLQEENRINSRVFFVSGIIIALSIGLYFLKNPALWQTLITAIILIGILIFSNSVIAYQIFYNRRIVRNIQQYPYLTITEDSIRFAEEEIYPETIYSVIHTNLKNANPLNSNDLIKNGEHILIFTQINDNTTIPYAVDSFQTLYTRVYSVALEDFEAPEQFLLSVEKISQANGISFTLNESSIERISNEIGEIRKSFTKNNDDDKVERSSLEYCAD